MHPNRRWRALRSRARSPRMHHASYPVFVHRPAALDWASSRPRLATTPLPFSLPSALRKPGHRTSTYEVTRHARRTRGASPALRGFIAQRPVELFAFYLVEPRELPRRHRRPQGIRAQLLSLHHELRLEVEPPSVGPLRQAEVLHARGHFSRTFHTPEAFSIWRRAGP
jgi:hypothetical protein